jgi:hypothetical protein
MNFKFRFNITDDQMVVGEGEIIGYSIVSEITSLPDLTIKVVAAKVKFEGLGNEITNIIELPPPGSFARVRGVHSTSLNSLRGQVTLDFSLYMAGIYPTYEAACTAEMKNKMENAR